MTLLNFPQSIKNERVGLSGNLQRTTGTMRLHHAITLIRNLKSALRGVLQAASSGSLFKQGGEPA